MVFNTGDHRTDRFGNIEVVFRPESIDVNFSLLLLVVPGSFLSFPGRLLQALAVLLEAERECAFVGIERRLTCHQPLGAPFFVRGCRPSGCNEALLTLGEHFGVIANSIVAEGAFQSRRRSILWTAKQIAILLEVHAVLNEDDPSLLEQSQELVVDPLVLFAQHLELLLLLFGHLVVGDFKLVDGQSCHGQTDLRASVGGQPPTE